MVLCICKCITEREIDAVVQSGARTVDAVSDRCGAGTDCGMCRDAIEERMEGSCGGCPRARDCHPGHAAVASAAP